LAVVLEAGIQIYHIHNNSLSSSHLIPNKANIQQVYWTSAGDHLLLVDNHNDLSHQKIAFEPKIESSSPRKFLPNIDGTFRIATTWPTYSPTLAPALQGLNGLLAVFVPSLGHYRSSQAGILDLDVVERRIQQQRQGENGVGVEENGEDLVIKPKTKEECEFWGVSIDDSVLNLPFQPY